MKLEIKFRGLRADGKGWVYGYYYATRANTNDPIDIHVIVVDDGENSIRCDVMPETVRQYTGLKDKNGVEIYEGDIVEDYKGDIYHIIFDEYYAAFMLRSSMIYSSSKRIEGSFDKKGNIFEDAFIEPEPRGIEPPSKTRSSDIFTRRNQKEALRGIGL